MTTLVTISDLHLDKETLGVPRAPEVERAITQAAKHAVEIKADWFVCLGDIADPDSGGATLRAIETVQRVALGLAARGIPSIWLAGNHDVVDDGSGATVLSPMLALTPNSGIIVVEDPRLIGLAVGLEMLCLPFAPVARAYDPAKVTKRLIDGAPTGSKIVVASHLNIPGIGPGEETLDMPRGRECMLDLESSSWADFRMSGHYHTRQNFDPGDGGPPIHVVGSPAAHSFGPEAEGERAFSVITL